MRTIGMKELTALVLGLFLIASAAAQDKPMPPPKPEEVAKAARAARAKGLDWLTKNQAKDGSWGKPFSVAVTSFACLAYLSASDEPFTGPHSQALNKGLEFLLSNQKDGSFVDQGNNSWIHSQGFATLALCETYGRSLFCKGQPDIDLKKTREVVVRAVAEIAKNQAKSGGWDYHGGQGPHGDATACAVQALVSANNFGLPIDDKVLEKGFVYLKRLQTKEGGFQYTETDTRVMREGTAAIVAALAMMNQFDSTVLSNGYRYLVTLTPAGISTLHPVVNVPYFGHFYGCLGMHLLGQQFKDVKEYRENTQTYITTAQKEVIGWQKPNGSFENKDLPDDAYSTAFATLLLSVTEGRLSIDNRTPPRAPKIAPQKP
jgi:hypothetical protein